VKRPLLALVFAALLALNPSIYSAAARADQVTLTVDPAAHLGTISPYVFGANYGPWGIIPVDLWPLAEAAGVRFLRFPAGNWGDDFDLMPYHIDPFIAFAKRINAEPGISVRLKGGTPEKAAEVVRYVNIEKQYSVRYWSIGNEPDLYRDYSVEKYNLEWRRFAEAMLAVDPGIIFVGPDVSQYPPTIEGDAYNNIRRDWVRAFLRANGDKVGIVSIHRYPFPRGNNALPTTIQALRETVREWDVMLPDLRGVVRAAAGRDIPLAVTEVNSDWSKPIGGEASPDSHFNAIWWAAVLGRMIRERVQMVAYFALESSGSLGAYGLLDRYAARPTYAVYPLYKQFGSELVDSASSDPDVSITASRRADGALTVMLVNLADDDKPAALVLAGFTPAARTSFDKTHHSAVVQPGFGADGAFTLPAQSVTLLIFLPN